MSKEQYTIYHNPRCSKSREALEILEEEGLKIEVVKYLENTPTEAELEKILVKLNLSPQDIIRKNESLYKQQFKNLTLNDHEWIKIMVQHPKLIERPIIIKGNKAIIGRPPTIIKELFLKN